MNTFINNFKNILPGFLFCLAIAIPSYFLGHSVPVVGGPVIAILIGMLITVFYKKRELTKSGITFTSKKILHWAVIFLGFGLNLGVIVETGKQSLPIIVSTIATSLIVAFLLHKILGTNGKIATMIGVGSSICGGSAVAATAPVIEAEDEEIAQAISIIFFFNVVAALIFPMLGNALHFDTTAGDAFGIFSGTAVNDTSSVTATASTWDAMHNLGTQALDKAVTVKLTRTLAIIPITLVLAFLQTKKNEKKFGNQETMESEYDEKLENQKTVESEYDEKYGNQESVESKETKKVSILKLFPMFILYFILASVITTIATSLGASPEVFEPMKFISKFFIILAMAAIGLSTDIVKLIKTGVKPLFMGFCCWISITAVSLMMQHILELW